MSNSKPQQAVAPSGNAAESGEISKVDLLRETGVSYGQFYRWKRMGLIPEAWFRRRSTFTGQGTFLPRKKVLDRIRQIQGLKSQYSLTRIAQMLSPDVVQRRYSSDDLAAMSWLSPRARALLPPAASEAGFLDVLCWTAIDRLLDAGSLRDSQVVPAGEALRERFGELDPLAAERRLTVITRDGETAVALHAGKCLFDRSWSVAASVDLNRLIEEIKVRLRDQIE